MAKHCDVCKQDYADELMACPHCAAAKKTHLAGRSEDRKTQLADLQADELGCAPSPADSAIDYGLPPTTAQATGDAAGAEPLSGASDVPWSALVEEPDVEKVKIDSPSDADLLAHAASTAATSDPHEELVGELSAEEPADVAALDSGVEAEGIDLAAAPPPSRHPVSDSAIDLGGHGPELAEDESGAVVNEMPAGDSAVFVAELASDAAHVELVGDSGVDLSAGDVVEVESPSAVDVDAPLHEPAAEAVEATIDSSSPAAELTEDAALDAAVLDEDSSAVDLGATPSAGSDALAVEAVEAVDESAETSAGEIDLDGLTVPAASDSSAVVSESMVDLGSHAEMLTPSPSEEGVVAEEAVVAEDEAVVAEESLSAADSVAAVEEPVVSEDDVNDLLASLEETPAVSASDGVAAEDAVEAAEGEEAIAAAEDEVAVEETEEEKKPSKPVKQRSRIPALIGGAFLGMLMGAGGLIGARVGGFDVPALMGLGEKEKTPVRSTGPTTPPATFDSLNAMVRNGDWEAARKAGIESIQDVDPKQLAARGDYRLSEYLSKVGAAKFNADDPALLPAKQDLQKAAEKNDADALFWLAFIKERAGKLAEAKADYTKALQTVANDPKQKQRFQAAIDRVEVLMSGGPGGEARLPLPTKAEDRAVLLALLLVSLQQPQPQPQPQPGQQPPAPAPAQEDAKEAGFEFWQAGKLAREGKFGDAIRAIDRARTLHDQRRFTRLRKAQNPLSDPAEDIFLRCCDELKVYWQLENRLRDGGYLTDKNTPQKALQTLVQKAEASTATIKDVTDKLIAEKIIAAGDDVSKGLGRLIDEKKKADAKADDLMAKLTKATDENTKLAGDLKTAKKTIEERDAALATAKDQNAKLKGDNEDLNATLKKITDELAAAKFLDPKGKPNVGEAVKKAVDVAKIKDPQGAIRQHRDEIAQLTSSLKERWQPEEMLPLWLLLLDENRNRAELAGQATKDVERVTTDPRAPMARKGEAAIVLGLALRNTEKFSEAKTVLEAARGSVDKGEWLARADAAFKDVSDPSAYFGRQAQELYDRGRMDEALAVLAHAAKVLPAKDQGKLSAQRSLIELDAARAKAKGALSPSDPLIVAARKDADDAVNAKLAEGHYAAGRINEELGQVDAAIKSYRAALAAHGDKVDADGGRYRMALARVLLLPQEGRPGQQPSAPKVGWRDPAPYPAQHLQDMKRLVLMFALGLQAPLLPGEEPGLEEAEKLADEVLKAAQDAPGSVPFNVLAQALAVKGRWNVALQTYVEGIRPMLPRRYGDGLVYLIRNDPRLKRPDSLRTPNPLQAEKHFAAGLNFYFDRDYANAEKEFLLTVENDSQDARFFYFLGLSRLAQNRRRDGYADFNQGAMLERLNRPSPAAVSESLERIQGPTRRIVNEFRQRPESSGRPER
jgi:tetratricopeptide (TPR) repeat protein